MKLSTLMKYGVRAMTEAGRNYGNTPLKLKIIARRQDVFVKYSQQL
jgi:DNA-binding IscR family transcriptional regulator